MAVALLTLMSPVFVHPALDAAGSAGILGLSSAETHRLSDRAVGELLHGPGSFTFPGPGGTPFLGAPERRHMGEARLLLLGFLVLAGASAAGIAVLVARTRAAARAAVWGALAAGGLATALVTLTLGLVSLVAFDTLFELFHRIAFPGGGWAFDPAEQRLVQLYPTRFWEIASGALAVLVVLLGALTWRLGSRAAARSAGMAAPTDRLARPSGGPPS